ncbi:MAG: anti-sigma factor [Sphingobium sp.]|uniref:anti-sigma factor n=1 Tax=Sphingobium sp. TaxID=1912891 RepID=UPI0029BA9943|nr:anti-sigma factor [Sphingobium sp.]MDX3908516.1 anti-sigma factor [Sphingobium sp.]
MTETPQLPPEDMPEDRSSLAAELALGVLTGAEKAAALRLQLADPAFAEEVTAWDKRLAPLYLDFAEQAPPPETWRGISARLDGPAVDTSGLIRRLQAWRTGALLSGALAASLAAMLLVRPSVAPPAPAPQVAPQMAVAQMVSPKADMMVVARYDAATAQLKLRADNMPQGELSPELWVIPADGKPRSLGFISPTGTTRMAVSPKMRIMLEDGVTLAITMEPPADTPHDSPSSAPVAAGKITVI